MTLTIPTAELVGTFADVLPFGSPDPKLPFLHAVQVEWDGEMLTARTTDRYTIGQSAWRPDDEPTDGVPAEDDLFTNWGSDDEHERWRVHLVLADAAEIVKVFKLPAVEGRTPLSVRVSPGRFEVRRARETGHAGLVYGCDTAALDAFPDIPRQLAKVHRGWDAVAEVWFSAKRLAGFSKVRPHGPLRLRFCGPEVPVVVDIGSRFTGAIMPVRQDEQEKPASGEAEGPLPGQVEIPAGV